eukprot:m.733876 g.733876  ORF g.733876 m.733876 type:complete len:74 (-) comp23075_c0_seq2:1194-1415(-)
MLWVGFPAACICQHVTAIALTVGGLVFSIQDTFGGGCHPSAREVSIPRAVGTAEFDITPIPPTDATVDSRGLY